MKYKITAEEYLDAENYLEQFLDHDYFDDYNIMWGQDIDLLASELVAAGSIDSRFCGKENQKIEIIVEKIAKNFNQLSKKQQQKRHKDCFKGVHVAECTDCNNHRFLNYGNEDFYADMLQSCENCDCKKINNYKFETPERLLTWDKKKKEWVQINSKLIRERLNIL